MLLGIVLFLRFPNFHHYRALSVFSSILKAETLFAAVKSGKYTVVQDTNTDDEVYCPVSRSKNHEGDENDVTGTSPTCVQQQPKKQEPGKNNHANNFYGLPSESINDAGVWSYDGKTSMLYYYYYDLNTGSFRLNDENDIFPKVPFKSVTKSTYFDTSFQSALALSGNYLPSLCPDRKTYGFSDLATLRSALQELSESYSSAVKAYHYVKSVIQEHFELSSESPHIFIEEPPMLPQHVKDFLNLVPDPFIICPGAHLRPGNHGKQEIIHINAEDVTIKCDSCVIDAKGTHISFGPLAKNVHIKGLAFVGATDTSIICRQDGASVLFEDCFFYRNRGVNPHGSVLDMNSTSSVEFHRCYVTDSITKLPLSKGGQELVPLPSFTLRNKELNMTSR